MNAVARVVGRKALNRKGATALSCKTLCGAWQNILKSRKSAPKDVLIFIGRYITAENASC